MNIIKVVNNDTGIVEFEREVNFGPELLKRILNGADGLRRRAFDEAIFRVVMPTRESCVNVKGVKEVAKLMGYSPESIRSKLRAKSKFNRITGGFRQWNHQGFSVCLLEDYREYEAWHIEQGKPVPPVDWCAAPAGARAALTADALAALTPENDGPYLQNTKQTRAAKVSLKAAQADAPTDALLAKAQALLEPTPENLLKARFAKDFATVDKMHAKEEATERKAAKRWDRMTVEEQEASRAAYIRLVKERSAFARAGRMPPTAAEREAERAAAAERAAIIAKAEAEAEEAEDEAEGDDEYANYAPAAEAEAGPAVALAVGPAPLAVGPALDA